MTQPVGVYVDGSAVLVHDGGNHRVLRWAAIPGPGSLGPPADDVIGQPDLDGFLPNAGGVSAGSLGIGAVVPAGAERAPDGLYLADPLNARVLRF